MQIKRTFVPTTDSTTKQIIETYRSELSVVEQSFPQEFSAYFRFIIEPLSQAELHWKRFKALHNESSIYASTVSPATPDTNRPISADLAELLNKTTAFLDFALSTAQKMIARQQQNRPPQRNKPLVLPEDGTKRLGELTCEVMEHLRKDAERKSHGYAPCAINLDQALAHLDVPEYFGATGHGVLNTLQGDNGEQFLKLEHERSQVDRKQVELKTKLYLQREKTVKDKRKEQEFKALFFKTAREQILDPSPMVKAYINPLGELEGTLLNLGRVLAPHAPQQTVKTTGTGYEIAQLDCFKNTKFESGVDSFNVGRRALVVKFEFNATSCTGSDTICDATRSNGREFNAKLMEILTPVLAGMLMEHREEIVKPEYRRPGTTIASQKVDIPTLRLISIEKKVDGFPVVVVMQGLKLELLIEPGTLEEPPVQEKTELGDDTRS